MAVQAMYAMPGPEPLRGSTDRIFWRIVPVGLVTTVLSSAMLVSFTCMNACAAPGIFGASLTFGLLALVFFGGVVWLPLFILWNAIVFRKAPVSGLRRTAVWTSFGMALVLCLLLVGVVADGLGWMALVRGAIWALASAGLAAGLTFLAFRRANMDELE